MYVDAIGFQPLETTAKVNISFMNETAVSSTLDALRIEVHFGPAVDPQHDSIRNLRLAVPDIDIALT